MFIPNLHEYLRRENDKTVFHPELIPGFRTDKNVLQAQILSLIHILLDLNDYIRPVNYRERTKCRVEYDVDIRNVEYAAYHFRPVSSLRLVVDDEADYRYKSRDRSVLNRLFACRETEDDVLVVRKGLLTDTSICNVAFWNRKQWITPSAPLLAGTCLLYTSWKIKSYYRRNGIRKVPSS